MSLLTMRRKRRHPPHSEGYWPGYVDALTNVVLNLLFLVAILAAGVFSLGMEASRKSLLPTTIDQVRFWVPALSSGRNVKAIDVSAASVAKDTRQVKLESVRPEGRQTLLQITFAGEALVLGDADRAALQPLLQGELQKAGPSTVAVWTVSDADPTNRRASYMRVMAVRTLLGEAGQDVTQVVTRILPGASADQHIQRVYVLLHKKGNQDDSE